VSWLRDDVSGQRDAVDNVPSCGGVFVLVFVQCQEKGDGGVTEVLEGGLVAEVDAVALEGTGSCGAVNVGCDTGGNGEGVGGEDGGAGLVGDELEAGRQAVEELGFSDSPLEIEFC